MNVVTSRYFSSFINIRYIRDRQKKAIELSFLDINCPSFYFASQNQQIINGISLPQQPLPLVQQQPQFVQQQVQTAPSTSKTTIIKAEVPSTPLAIQQIQVGFKDLRFIFIPLRKILLPPTLGKIPMICTRFKLILSFIRHLMYLRY